MKKTWLWFALGFAVLAAVIYSLLKKPATAAVTPPSQVNTGTGGIVSKFASSWGGFDAGASANTSANQLATQNKYAQIGTLFGQGFKTLSGTSMFGSNFGGVTTTGGGAGVPTTPDNGFSLFSNLDNLTPNPLPTADDSSDYFLGDGSLGGGIDYSDY
jgi:hypothetical protein